MPCFAGAKAIKLEPPARSSPEYQVDVSCYPVMKPRGRADLLAGPMFYPTLFAPRRADQQRRRLAHGATS